MQRLLVLTLGAALFGAGCGASASDADPSLGAAALGGAAAQPAATKTARNAAPVVRGITIPTGTLLHLKLTSAVASDTSRVEDAVNAEVTQAVMIDGRTAIPAGAKAAGVVTGVQGSGRVKGRASLAFGFSSVTIGTTRYDMQAETFAQLADATKGEDATKIGIGAGAGATIGAFLGGKKGAAEGAAVGSGAGTGLVLATKGKEVELASGTDVSTRLTAPLIVRAGR